MGRDSYEAIDTLVRTMPAPRKPKLGQHFLVDDDARRRIVDALGDVSGRTVLEIGPGRGAITNLLAGRARRLIAVEVDRALAAELAFRFRHQPEVEVRHYDILKSSLQEIAGDEPLDVIGNLPYYITSDILLHLFAGALHLHRAVLMMQREVADRVTAAPGVRDFGLLSATTQMYAEAENLFTLPPDAFAPPPEVFSSVVRLSFRPRFGELGVDPAGFDRFLHQAFAHKRKTLANNLRAAGYDAARVVHAWPRELPAQARAEATTLSVLATLYRELHLDPRR